VAPPPALPVTPPPPGSACGGGSAALAGAESPCTWSFCTGSVTSDCCWFGHFGLLLVTSDCYWRRREPAAGNVIQAQRTGASGKEPDEGVEEEPDSSFEAAMPCGAWTPWRVKSRFEIKN
jgi:hypothetical protein